MRLALKIVAWSLLVLVVLAGAATAGVYYFLTSDYLRRQIESRADRESGHATKIGKLAIDWGRITHVHIEDVQIANADWGQAPQMFKAQEIECEIRIWPLLHGNVELPLLRLVKPELYLERSPDDDFNWSSGQTPVATTAVKQAVPAHRHQTPVIGQIEIVDGHLGYRDIKRKLDLNGTVQTATGQAGQQSQAQLSLQGRLEGQPLTLHFTGGSVLMLRDTETPYPTDLDVTYGQTHLTVKGTLQDPFQFKGADVTLSLSGEDLSQIFPLLGIPGPPTPPYRLVGRLDRAGDLWKLDDMQWHVGDSDISGNLSVDQGVKPAKLTARLTSQNLVFADLAPLVGASPGKSGNVSAEQKKTAAQLEEKGELFPDTPLHVDRLRAMNMDVTLEARKVVAPDYLPVHGLMFHLVVEDGEARVQPLKLAFGGGTLEGMLGIDARPDQPKVWTDLKGDNIDLAEFFRNTRFFDTTQGKLQARIHLAGTGKSLAAVMGSSDGDIIISMAGGSISDLMVSLANLQIASALVLYVAGDHRIPLRCAMGRLNVSHGTVAFDRTLMDTQRSVLHFDGKLTLGDQVLKSRIVADPKKFDLLDLHAPVLISGKLRKPDVTIGRAIPIPTPDFGGAKDVACEEMTRQLMAEQ